MRRPLAQAITFARYRLIERIGHGGMATVYRAKAAGPAGFERDVVVKMMLPALAETRSFVEMFVHEAKIAARLNHSNIAQVYELGVVEGTVFIAMEYIDGVDLAELLADLARRRTRLPVEAACFIARELCDALGYAHTALDAERRPLRLIHRDVSPANVMLGRDGSVKLLDFGIAKLLQEGPRDRTQTGTLKGKYGYMSPEQATGRPIDQRVDLFATGVVLHEMLTGRRLFKGETDLETLRAVAAATVAPPSIVNPDVPPALDALVLRSLARDPDDRFATAQEMSEALDGLGEVVRLTRPRFAAIIVKHCPVETATQSAISPREISLETGLTTVWPGGARPSSRPALEAFGAGAASVASAGIITPSTRPTPPPPAFEPELAVDVDLRRHVPWRRIGVWLGVAALVCAVGVGVGRTLGTVAPPPTVLPMNAAPVSTQADPRASTEISVTIDSEPEGAEVSLGGARIGKTPFVWQTRRANAPATLRMERPGYRVANVVTALDRDSHLLVTLASGRGDRSERMTAAGAAPARAGADEPAERPDRSERTERAAPSKPASPGARSHGRANPDVNPDLRGGGLVNPFEAK